MGKNFLRKDRDVERKPELTPEEKAKIAKEHELARINEQADISHAEGSDMIIVQGDETRVVRPEKKKKGEKVHTFDVISIEEQNRIMLQAREELMKEAYSPQEIEEMAMDRARKIAKKEYRSKDEEDTEEMVDKILKTAEEEKEGKDDHIEIKHKGY